MGINLLNIEQCGNIFSGLQKLLLYTLAGHVTLIKHWRNSKTPHSRLCSCTYVTSVSLSLSSHWSPLLLKFIRICVWNQALQVSALQVAHLFSFGITFVAASVSKKREKNILLVNIFPVKIQFECWELKWLLKNHQSVKWIARDDIKPKNIAPHCWKTRTSICISLKKIRDLQA